MDERFYLRIAGLHLPWRAVPGKPLDFDRLNPKLSAWKPLRQTQCNAFGLITESASSRLPRTEVVVEFIKTQGFSPPSKANH